MTIGPDEVRRVAALAHLDLEEGEIGQSGADMRAILGHADRLGTDETHSPTEPTAHDELRASPPDPDPEALSGTRGHGADAADRLAAGPEAWAPRFEDGFFVVPPPPGVHADDPEDGA